MCENTTKPKIHARIQKLCNVVRRIGGCMGFFVFDTGFSNKMVSVNTIKPNCFILCLKILCLIIKIYFKKFKPCKDTVAL